MTLVATLSPLRRALLPRVENHRSTASWEQELEAASRERVRQARAAIATRTYITDEKIDIAIERLMADL